MYTCVFFGHPDCPDSMKPLGVLFFHVGYRGRFHKLVAKVLRDLAIVYPEIQYSIEIPYSFWFQNYEKLETGTMITDGSEAVAPRYGWEYCDRWILRQAEIVVTYGNNTRGRAAKMFAQAEHQGKQIIRLTEI